MEQIILNNGVSIPNLGFGTYTLMGEECAERVKDAIAIGYRLLDTAQMYGNEAAVGEGIRASGIDRPQLFLVTKVDMGNYRRAGESVLESLEKLGLDYVDMVLLHWPFGDYYAAWRDLEQLYREKKIRAIGVSNFEADRLVDLIQNNTVVPAVNQIETNLLCQQKPLRQWMDRYQVAHMAYAPLGHGNRAEMFENADLDRIARDHGKTKTQVALKFLLQKQIIVIPRSRSLAHIRDNFALDDLTLSDEEMKELEAMDTETRKIQNPADPEKVIAMFGK
jgi:diketogulonate reductase-like aldo/keto reductase